MDDIDDFPVNQMHVGMKLTFSGIRVLDTELFPVNFTLLSELVPSDPEKEQDAEFMSAAYRKVKYFVTKILNGSIFMFKENDWACQAFVDCQTGMPSGETNIVLLPHEATNAVICEVIQAKLKALTKGEFDFTFIQLESSDDIGLSFTFIGNSRDELPDMEEWVGKLTYFSEPWWNRDDSSTFDLTPGLESDLDCPPEFAYSLAFLDDTFPMEGKVIRREFRPRVIQGGKVD